MPSYDYRHVVGFEETNLVGNVYYANHIRWQGRCREMFLRQHAPDVLRLFDGGLALVTVRCSCDYLAELIAFDEVIIRMTLDRIIQNRIAMRFEYLRVSDDAKHEHVARGTHEVACMLRKGNVTVPAPIPESLRHALESYAGSGA